jgi:hypothetical protein
VAAGALVLLLSRPGTARAMTVWGLAALLPVLGALSAALAAQGRASRVLGSAPRTASRVTFTTAGVARTLTLAPPDAACVERARYLSAPVTLDTPSGPLVIGPGTRVDGTLPTREAVEAQVIRETLSCPHVHAVRAR